MTDTTLYTASELLSQNSQAEKLKLTKKVKGEHLTDTQRKEIKKISQDFEALFTGMMIKSMRATVPEDRLTGGGRAEETYRYMLDQEYATAASQRGGVGSLATMVEKELLKQYDVPAQPTISDKGGE